MAQSQIVAEKTAGGGTSEAICVGVRLRPFVGHEKDQKEVLRIQGNTVSIISDVAAGHALMKGNADAREYKSFTFDHAMNSFDPSSPSCVTQAKCYDLMARGMVEHIFQGYSTCLFCYGQTGTGKTMTIMGNMTPEHEQGLLIRLLRDVFSEVLSQRKQGYTFDIHVQIVEVYNEKVKDLLRPLDGGESKLDVHVHPKHGVYIKGALEENVESFDHCLTFIEHSSTTKSVAATAMNAKSSRAHTVFKLKLARSGGADSLTVNSEVFFVDLAGRENEKTTKVTGDRMLELTFINKSLLWLAQCIKSLGDKKHHDVAARKDMSKFRNSKLTLLLSNALSGNSKTAMIGTLSPAAAHFDESQSTLVFASTVKNIKLEARAKTAVDKESMVAGLQEEIRALKEQLMASSDSHTSSGMDEAQAQELRQQIESAQALWEEERGEALKLQQRLDDEQAQALELQKKLADEHNETVNLQKQLQGAKTQLTVSRLSVAVKEVHSQKQLQVAKTKLDEEQAQALELQKKLADEHLEAVNLRKQLEGAKTKLDDEQAQAMELQKKLADEHLETVNLQKQLQGAKTKLDDEQAQAMELQKKLADEHNETVNLQKQLQGAKSKLTVTRLSLAVKEVQLERRLSSAPNQQGACGAKPTNKRSHDVIHEEGSDDECGDVEELRSLLKKSKSLCDEYKNKLEVQQKENLDLQGRRRALTLQLAATRFRLAVAHTKVAKISDKRSSSVSVNMANIGPMATELLSEAQATGTDDFGASGTMRLKSLIDLKHATSFVKEEGHLVPSDAGDHVSGSNDQPAPLKGFLWKRSPSRLRVLNQWDRRFVTLIGGRLSWCTDESSSDNRKARKSTVASSDQARGFVDLPKNRCRMDDVLGSDSQFCLHVEGGSGNFTGGDARTFSFDCAGSEHSRSEWIESLQAHMHCIDAPIFPAEEMLRSGALKLVSGKWLFRQPPTSPAIGRQHLPNAAFLEPSEAVSLYQECGCLVVLT